MTGNEVITKASMRFRFGAVYHQILSEEIDAALAAERDRCEKIVWEYRGMCVSDESARALMAEVRRER